MQSIDRSPLSAKDLADLSKALSSTSPYRVNFESLAAAVGDMVEKYGVNARPVEVFVAVDGNGRCRVVNAGEGATPFEARVVTLKPAGGTLVVLMVEPRTRILRCEQYARQIEAPLWATASQNSEEIIAELRCQMARQSAPNMQHVREGFRQMVEFLSGTSQDIGN